MGVDASTARIRFGLGARPDELASVGADGTDWLLDQLGRASPSSEQLAKIDSSSSRLARFAEARRQGRDAVQAFHRDMRTTWSDDAMAVLRHSAQSTQPFRERLTRFWVNHFTVSVVRREVLGLAAPFEQEAIRPHVCGRFADMLLASTRHPAMQLYLDNFRSVGPDSIAGERRDLGLNENLAREVLELHTLGVNGGYDQRDVEAFAAMLTGWGFTRKTDITPGFRFDPIKHQPGGKTLLGQRYAEAGEQEAQRALEVLARHPSTAHFIATKLARHFVSDTPPSGLVEHLARVFLDTDGDLGAVSRALVTHPEAGDPAPAKIKSPIDLVMSTARALDYDNEGKAMLDSLEVLGQPLYRAPGPDGWPDEASHWLAPQALMTRIDWAEQVATQGQAQVADALQLAHSILGTRLDPETEQALAQCPDHPTRLALLFASPAFQRR